MTKSPVATILLFIYIYTYINIVLYIYIKCKFLFKLTMAIPLSAAQVHCARQEKSWWAWPRPGRPGQWPWWPWCPEPWWVAVRGPLVQKFGAGVGRFDFGSRKSHEKSWKVNVFYRYRKLVTSCANLWVMQRVYVPLRSSWSCALVDELWCDDFDAWSFAILIPHHARGTTQLLADILISVLSDW